MSIERYTAQAMVTKRTQAPITRVPRRKSKQRAKDPTLWEDIAAIGRRIPEDVLRRLPRDAGRNLDHYLYGKPKSD